jgi:hypothetical protein
MNTCGCCKFWQRPDAGRVTGECRRHAPVAVAPSQQKYALRMFAWTQPDDWCGEFVKKAGEINPDGGYPPLVKPLPPPPGDIGGMPK